MTTLTRWLRDCSHCNSSGRDPDYPASVCRWCKLDREAADEIDRLQALVAFVTDACMQAHSLHMGGTCAYRFRTYHLGRTGRDNRTAMEALLKAKELYDMDIKAARAAGGE